MQKIGLSTNSYGVFHQMFSENITNNSLKGHYQLERFNYHFLTSQLISGVNSDSGKFLTAGPEHLSVHLNGENLWYAHITAPNEHSEVKV